MVFYLPSNLNNKQCTQFPQCHQVWRQLISENGTNSHGYEYLNSASSSSFSVAFYHWSIANLYKKFWFSNILHITQLILIRCCHRLAYSHCCRCCFWLRCLQWLSDGLRGKALPPVCLCQCHHISHLCSRSVYVWKEGSSQSEMSWL